MTETSEKTYDFTKIEAKWQAYWQENKTFAAVDGLEKPKFYVLDMFPYPSGDGLHVGHPEGYTASDIVTRHKRMAGFNVLHPMGWDAFGLPAEQYAVATGTHPSITTENNIANIRRQIQMLGFSYDWDREIDTTDPKYYRWTQWIFLQLYNSYFDHDRQKARPISELIAKLESDEYLFDTAGQAAPRVGPKQLDAYTGDASGLLKFSELSHDLQHQILDEHRLAYQAEVAVNWCPALGTVLANEEVIGGLSERGDHPVVRKPMRQWMLRITDYCERLLAGLDDLDWSQGIKKLQSDWIGKSVGADVDFCVVGHEGITIGVFTTRPDTLFGATYMVLAPEHPLVAEITTGEQREEVAEYIEAAARKSDLDRTDLAKEKTGVFTGAYAVNPVNEKQIPIWISDYVLISYGTGAIMAVPAHDTRDFEFAQQFDIPIIPVVKPDSNAALTIPEAEKYDKNPQAIIDAVMSGAECFSGDGVAVNSGQFDGQPTAEFKKNITAWLQEQGAGGAAINYKLRDWLFSRQRYWGEPFPIVHLEDGSTAPLDEDELPLMLPEVDSYQASGTGESPLANITDWLNITYKGQAVRRETNTMPQWAGSCWYFLRYLDPDNDQAFCDPEKENYWMPVDLYIGGAEHAVLHLLYSRFWHKVLYDLGHVSTDEPFTKLVNQGMILGDDSQKMSKSRGNVVNPDQVIADYGADSMRLYEMFMGPLEAVKPWSMHGVEGVHRFLNKAWRMIVAEDGGIHAAVTDTPVTGVPERLLHKTIKKVTEDIENLAFNTAISQMMIFVNEYLRLEARPRQAIETFVLLLSPFAPHIAEELWQLLGHKQTLAYEPWPQFDPALTQDPEVELAIQVNGKVRDRIIVPAGTDEEVIKQIALETEKTQAALAGLNVRKVIVIKSRLVNIVAN